MRDCHPVPHYETGYVEGMPDGFLYCPLLVSRLQSDMSDSPREGKDSIDKDVYSSLLLIIS